MFEELLFNFDEVLLSVLDLLLFCVIFKREVRLWIAFGEFLHFDVRVYLIAFPEFGHALNTGHEFLFLVIVVGLSKNVDDFFGKVRDDLNFLVFLLGQKVTVSFPLEINLLVEFLHIKSELVNDITIVCLFIL